jgi:hypothetical protein
MLPVFAAVIKVLKNCTGKSMKETRLYEMDHKAFLMPGHIWLTQKIIIKYHGKNLLVKAIRNENP